VNTYLSYIDYMHNSQVCANLPILPKELATKEGMHP
jgi:hypothetical protein